MKHLFNIGVYFAQWQKEVLELATTKKATQKRQKSDLR